MSDSILLGMDRASPMLLVRRAVPRPERALEVLRDAQLVLGEALTQLTQTVRAGTLRSAAPGPMGLRHLYMSIYPPKPESAYFIALCSPL